MNLIKQHTHQYMVFVDLKSAIKAEECQEKTLKSDLEKLQKEELSDCVDNIKWKIKRAEFILACEKKRHDYFYGIMETAEESISKDSLYQQFKKYGMDISNYRVQLEEEKCSLIKQLEELKQ